MGYAASFLPCNRLAAPRPAKKKGKGSLVCWCTPPCLHSTLPCNCSQSLDTTCSTSLLLSHALRSCCLTFRNLRIPRNFPRICFEGAGHAVATSPANIHTVPWSYAGPLSDPRHQVRLQTTQRNCPLSLIRPLAGRMPLGSTRDIFNVRFRVDVGRSNTHIPYLHKTTCIPWI